MEVSVGSRASQQGRAVGRSGQGQVGRRDWGDFSFSHFGGGGKQQQVVKMKPGMAGMQRELGIDAALLVMGERPGGGGGGQGIGAKYVRNRGEGMGFQRRR